MTGQVTILNHQHPAFAIADQSQPKGFPKRVAGTKQIAIALASQQVPQRVPGQLKRVFKSLDQTLLLPFIQRRGLKEALQLLQSPPVVRETLLPADVLS